VQYIHAKTACAAHFAVSIQRGVHGERLQRVASEPLGELCHILAAGVVEVLPRGEDLHCLRPGAIRKVKQTWMQAMIQE
jgi:lipid A disaccharide synthetase